jgi:hypothetical protein
VEDARRALQVLSRTAATVQTAAPTIWTFMGHWEDDEIVVDFAVPGKVQDDRQDERHAWPQGLWADHGEGAAREQAQAAAIAAYQPDDEPAHDPECQFGGRPHAGACHTDTSQAPP